MRGKVAPSSSVSPVIGITPAYAGKRYTITSTGIVYQDHPRLCGEKLDLLICPVYDWRITPAYAGKSAEPDKSHNQLQDHPRLCGEKFAAVWITCTLMGSPPPMRGKV